jgi:hypothetical protein
MTSQSPNCCELRLRVISRRKMRPVKMLPILAEKTTRPVLLTEICFDIFD